MDMTRRDMLKNVGIAAGTLAVLGDQAMAQNAAQPPPPTGSPLAMSPPEKYTLGPLPYAYNALAPSIGEQTLRIHHDKHHAKYVQDLNSTLEKLHEAMAAGHRDQMDHLATLAAFNGSGHLLHSLYWENMKPDGGGKPVGDVAACIERDFGPPEAFTAAFAAMAGQIRGSGWAVLAWEPLGRRLVVCGVEQHQNEIFAGSKPLLVCDVWEHAYYLDYQNERPRYVETFLGKLVNWDVVNRRLSAAQA